MSPPASATASVSPSPDPDPDPEAAADRAARAAPPPAPTVLWDDGYEPAVPPARGLRRLVLGAAVVIAGAGAAGWWLASRGAAPARELATPEEARFAAAPVEPALPRDTGPPLPARRPLPPPAPHRSVVVAPGRLFVGATPWGDLFIDNRLIGHTPQAAVPIRAGWHQVRIVRDGFAPFEQRIHIAPGEDVRLTGIVLRSLGP